MSRSTPTRPRLQLTLADVRGLGHAELQKECFERGLLGGIPKTRSNKYLVDDLKAGLVDHIKSSSGSAFLTELASGNHPRSRERKAGYQRKEKPPGHEKQKRAYTGATSTWQRLNERCDDVSLKGKNNALRRLEGTGGNLKLYCDDCHAQVSGETARRHCDGAKHLDKKLARLRGASKVLEGRQSSIVAALHRAGANPKTEFLRGQETYRFSLVAGLMQAGVPLNAMDKLRKPIEAGSQYTLGDASNAKKHLVPIIRDWEVSNVKRLLDGSPFSWFHDGATRGVECLSMVFRVVKRDEVTAKLKYVQVLGRLKMLPKSHNGLTLAGDQAAAAGRLGLDMSQAVYACSDACATNIAAVDNLALMYPNIFYGLCMSHLGANAGSKIGGSEIDKFFTDFISIVNHSGAKQKTWSQITGLPHVGYGGVRWFNRYDVLKSACPTLGRESSMQRVIASFDDGTSQPGRRLHQQGDYSTPQKTEQLHVEWVTEVVIGGVLKPLTYFAEGDQLNIIFKMHIKMVEVDSKFTAILDPSDPGDVLTSEITALHNAGHLQTFNLQHWLDHAHNIAKPAIEYWNVKSRGGLAMAGPYAKQRQLYRIAHRFNPHICGAESTLPLQQLYEQLRGLKFPDAMVSGLKSEAMAAINDCAGVGDVTDVVNYWDARRELLPWHAKAAQRLALMQPSEASCERVFSRLKSHFSLDQMSTLLEDLVEAAIMLDYNDRNVVDPWC